MNLSKYLKQKSKEICELNGCTENEHKCESIAYITRKMDLLDVCISDYFQGTSEPHAAIPLPWNGTQKELEKEVREQIWEPGN